MIYFIRDANGHGPIKIGYSVNPNRRLKELQNTSPVKLTILGMIGGDHNKEKVLHTKFESIRLWGEWFEATPELINFIHSFAQENEPQVVSRIIVGNDYKFTERHYKLADLAKALSVSVRTLRRWIDAGKLAAVQVGEGKGSELFVPISELIRLGFRVKKSDE